jgi:methyl-accepting chemotaxis protein
MKEIKKDMASIKALNQDRTINAMVASISTYINTYSYYSDEVYSTDTKTAKTIHFSAETNLLNQKLDPAVNALVLQVNKMVDQNINSDKMQNRFNDVALLILMIIILVLSILFGRILIRSIITPLKTLQAQLDEIAHGEGDLTKEIEVKTKDELGILANTFNLFLQTMRLLIGEVRTGAERVTESSNTLNQTSREIIAGTQSMNQSVQEAAVGSETQSEMASQSANAVSEMAIGVSQIAENATDVSMQASEATTMAEEGQEALTQLIEQVKTINHGVDESVKSIEALDHYSNSISKILSFIQEISEQTNLLALNAAIEAARAGESGKGFAVVAEEIRSLAEDSTQSSKQVADLIQQIAKETKDTVLNIKNVQKRVEEGNSFVSLTQAKFIEIMNSFETITYRIQEISATSEELSAGSEEISATVQEMAELSEKASGYMKEVSQYSTQHLESLAHVQKDSIELTQLSKNLDQLVGQFVLE